MPQQEQQRATDAVSAERKRLSGEEEAQRKQRVLARGESSITSSIADAVVIKNENLFFLSNPEGNVPLEDGHGFGLYYHDCRYLNGYELKLAGQRPNVLVGTAERGFEAVFQLTNPDIKRDENVVVQKESVGVEWRRFIDGSDHALYDSFTFENFALEEVEFPVSLSFQCAFEDVYAVRGMLPKTLGELVRPPEWHEGTLSFLYKGADDLYRSLNVHFSPTPDRTDGTSAYFTVKLGSRESMQLRVSLYVAESPHQDEVEPKSHSLPSLPDIEAEAEWAFEEWAHNSTDVSSDSLLLNDIIDRSLRDLYILQSQIAGRTFFAAGVPWFATLFGRDSVITALQTLAFNPDIAAQTLRVLAEYQGQEVNEWKEEAPGKILHELRIGEMAHVGAIPHTPYYGTVDATPLFLILMAQHAAWTGDLTVFNDLRHNIELALEWISTYGDSDGDGYVEYKSSSEQGLINQGWKDAGDSIVDQNGLADPPIALVEVQGYVYQAKRLLADLYDRAGEPDRADSLRDEARRLRERFNRDYWWEEEGIYVLALEKGQQRAAVVSSNPGHALWSGIADDEKARRTMQRLLADDMTSGWGIRTLSKNALCYNPVGYHLGTVWPHDNAIIAAGFRRYGYDDAAARVFANVLEASTHFDYYRLPELWSGFGRNEYHVPVRYPVACHPQAWGAGSTLYFLTTFLGLQPEAFDRRLRIVRPMLPDYVDHITVERLRVENARVKLRFERAGDDVRVRVQKVDGDLDVMVESK